MMETNPVATPSHRRPAAGSGKVVDIKPDSKDEITSWPNQPNIRPSVVPMINTIPNCIVNNFVNAESIAIGAEKISIMEYAKLNESLSKAFDLMQDPKN